MTDKEINEAIERLRQDCHPTKPSPYSVVDCGVQRIADILAVCDYSEKASKVVEAAAHLRLPCADWTTSESKLRRCGACWFCKTHKALDAMEEQ